MPEEREQNAWSEGVAIWVAVFIVSGVGAFNDWNKGEWKHVAGCGAGEVDQPDGGGVKCEGWTAVTLPLTAIDLHPQRSCAWLSTPSL